MLGVFNMIQVFCDKRGSGKTKALVQLANEKVPTNNGNMVYIDDDRRLIYDLDRKIRFISANEYSIATNDAFYGFLCGILSEDYDIDTIFIDGLLNIVKGNLLDAAHLFSKIEKLENQYKVSFYININGEESLPDFIKKYVCSYCVA